MATVERDFLKIGDVRVRDEPRIDIWARAPLPVPYITLHAETFEAAFDREAQQIEKAGERGVQPPVALGGGVALQSAELQQSTLERGNVLHLTLRWQLDEPLTDDYKMFVHVVDESERPLVQWDGWPGMNTRRTAAWLVGREGGSANVEHVLLPVPPEIEPGEYGLRAGLYSAATGERLGNQSINIGEVVVR